MERFFTDAFAAMSDGDKESFYKTVILHDTSDYAAAVRLAYYSKTLKHLGKNVKIGAGVKSSIRSSSLWVTTLPFPMT